MPPVLAARSATPKSNIDLSVEARANVLIQNRCYAKAVEVLFRAYGTVLHGAAFRLCIDRDLTEEVMAAVALEVVRDIHRWSGRSSLRTWLLRVVRNNCLDALRVVRREARRTVDLDVAVSQADPGPLVADHLLTRELSPAVERCLSALTPNNRTAVVLRLGQALSWEEVADVLLESPDGVRMRVARTLEALRRCLRRSGFEDLGVGACPGLDLDSLRRLVALPLQGRHLDECAACRKRGSVLRRLEGRLGRYLKVRWPGDPGWAERVRARPPVAPPVTPGSRRLPADRPQGILRVDTETGDDYRVVLDGLWTGQRTPLRRRVDAGRHCVEVELERGWVWRRVEVPAGGEVELVLPGD